MDAYEATRIVFSRIQSIDPENAAKIMGFLLIQDHGDKEMIRLAFGPESLIHSLILKACNELGLSPFFPLSRQNSSRLLRSHSPASADFNVLSPNGFHHNVKSNHIDEFHLQDHLSFLDETPKDPDLFFPSSDTDAMFFNNSPPPNWDQHRRSLSVTDIGSDPFGWKPCLYYARGYCKNGTSCRFLHESPDSTAFGAEFDVMDQCRELLRSRSLKHCQHQQQRLTNASQLLASGSFPYTGSKCSNFLLQQQQNDTLRAAAGLMLDGDDLHHYGRSRIERSDFLSIPGGMANSASRQIYLTFPADSTFREEDVSNYFSIYGPVQDVRIPYQQKRMFGFVTFIYSETVKLILAKGNPHFVCDARVLVKPYKEKGKVPDRKQQQPMMELGDFSPSGITGHDHRDPFDLQFSMQMESSPRMYNTNELLMRRKLEQAELQQAMELHSRKLMGLHLFDGNKHHRRNLSTGTGSVPSPIHSHAYVNQNFMIPTSSPGQSSPMTQLDNCAVSCATSLSLSTIADNVSKPQAELDRGDNDAEENFKHGDNNTHVSVEHNLPDNPFASPTKSNADPSGMSFTSAAEVGQSVSATLAPSSPSNNTSLISSLVLPATSTLDMASFKSCYLQMPRNAESNQDQGGLS